MPTYSYRCTQCETAFDIHQAFTDSSLSDCPTCDGRLRKVYSSIGVTFNGSGFYRNDSRAAGKGKGKGATDATSPAGASPSGSSEKAGAGASGSASSGSTASGSASSGSASSGSASSGSASSGSASSGSTAKSRASSAAKATSVS